jgi:hypothetical protein
MFENGKDNRIETRIAMLPPPPTAAPPPQPAPVSRAKPARPSLFRMARALQAAMAAKGWDARELSEQLRADGIILSQSGIESWMAAEHCPSVVFRDAVAKKLEMDPELLKPEGETDLERVLRERAEKGVETRRRNEALLGRRRSSRLAKFGVNAPEEAPAEAPPVAEPAGVENDTQKMMAYFVDPATNLGHLWLSLRQPHQELLPLVELINQHIASLDPPRP